MKGCLTPDETAELGEAYKRIMVHAKRHDHFGTNGTRMVVGGEENDRMLARFVVHPNITKAMQVLWGRPGLYVSSDIWSNRDDTPWHTDGMPGRARGSVKVTTYLDKMDADQGSLNFIPGSHLPENSDTLFRNFGYFDRGRPRLRIPREQIPGAVSLSTLPGDVVIWDTRLWHSAFKRQDGEPRRALFFSFLPDHKGDPLQEEFVRQSFNALLKKKGAPVYGPNLLAHVSPQMWAMIERLEELGVKNVRTPAS